MVSERSATSWVQWLIFNVMLAAMYSIWQKPEIIRNKGNILAVKNIVTELISRAKGTEYAHALGNLIDPWGSDDELEEFICDDK